MRETWFNTLISGCVALFLATLPALAAEVEERLQPSALSFKGGASYTNAKLDIYGPDDFEATETSSRGLPVFRIRGGALADGVYRYALSAATDIEEPIKKQINDGRGSASRDFAYKSFHMQGAFRISGGLIEPLESGSGSQDEG